MPATIDIRAQIVEGLQRVLPKSAEIQGQTNIVQDLGLDSLAIMDFILAIEDRFDISMPLDQVAEIVTVDDLVRTVESLLRKEQA